MQTKPQISVLCSVRRLFWNRWDSLGTFFGRGCPFCSTGAEAECGSGTLSFLAVWRVWYLVLPVPDLFPANWELPSTTIRKEVLRMKSAQKYLLFFVYFVWRETLCVRLFFQSVCVSTIERFGLDLLQISCTALSARVHKTDENSVSV